MDAVLFDFNGVLVDDEHIHYDGFDEVLAPHGVQMTPASYAERYLGFDDRRIVGAMGFRSTTRTSSSFERFARAPPSETHP